MNGLRLPENRPSIYNLAFAVLLASQCSVDHSAYSPSTNESDVCRNGFLSTEMSVLASGWGLNLQNTRHQTASRSTIFSDNVMDLTLAWSYAFRDTNERRGHPAVTDQAVFTGSQTGAVLALDIKSGCLVWQFDADSQVRGGFTVVENRSVENRSNIQAEIFFSDTTGNVYALSAATGELHWKRKITIHKTAKLTGTPTYFDQSILVPVSSSETGLAALPFWVCCTFRGSLVRLNALTGDVIWRTYTIVEKPQAFPNSHFIGPSGSAVWSEPTVDINRRYVYIGTGQNYSMPASAYSDAILAIDFDTGTIQWAFQATPNDNWNLACFLSEALAINCPTEPGFDHDFGASPILVTTASGRDVLYGGQKSGKVFAIDPDNGQLIWQRRLGSGGNLGGIHWGMAADTQKLYVAVADFNANKQYLLDGEDALGATRLSHGGSPGLYALDLENGKILWQAHPKSTLQDGTIQASILSAAVSVTNDVVFTGALDGALRAYDSDSGRMLWQFETAIGVDSVNGVPGHGGTIDGGGPVLAGDSLYINSGYFAFAKNSDWYGGPGNLLMAFKPGEQKNP